jgi:hypothetical protein
MIGDCECAKVGRTRRHFVALASSQSDIGRDADATTHRDGRARRETCSPWRVRAWSNPESGVQRTARPTDNQEQQIWHER